MLVKPVHQIDRVLILRPTVVKMDEFNDFFSAPVERAPLADVMSMESVPGFTWAGLQQPTQDFNLDNFDTEVKKLRNNFFRICQLFSMVLPDFWRRTPSRLHAFTNPDVFVVVFS